MDYIGCYLTPLGIGTNLMFIEFYCYTYYQILFILVGVCTIFGAIFISTLSIYQTEQYRSIRFILSILSAMPYLVGMIVAIFIVHDKIIPNYYMYLWYALLIECMAGFFYVTMLPEIIYPVIFDILLPSHSIWHWLNLGFDFMSFHLSYNAFISMKQYGLCFKRYY
jgi:hypothetical protein